MGYRCCHWHSGMRRFLLPERNGRWASLRCPAVWRRGSWLVEEEGAVHRTTATASAPHDPAAARRMRAAAASPAAVAAPRRRVCSFSATQIPLACCCFRYSTSLHKMEWRDSPFSAHLPRPGATLSRNTRRVGHTGMEALHANCAHAKMETSGGTM